MNQPVYRFDMKHIAEVKAVRKAAKLFGENPEELYRIISVESGLKKPDLYKIQIITSLLTHLQGKDLNALIMERDEK